VKTDEELIWESYIKEAVVPFKKRREVRRGISKKHGKRELMPYTFGFDIEFSVPMHEETISYMIDPDSLREDAGYIEWVKAHTGVDEPDYETIDEWENDNPIPDEDDYENEDDYNEAYEKWTEEKENMEGEISDFRYVFDEVDYTENYKDHLIRTGQWAEYVNIETGTIDNLIYDVKHNIKRVMYNYSYQYEDADEMWDVSEDAARDYEVTSPILTTKDIPMVKDVLEVIGEYGETAGNTSAHIHIGIPDDFDYFDLITLYDLVDEETLLNKQPNRQRAFTKLKPYFFQKIARFLNEKYKDGDIIDVIDFKEFSHDRYMGVNISNVSSKISNFKKEEKKKSYGNTVEFRYLSSEIFDHSDGIDDFLEWIEYFMIIMRLAKSRNQIKFKYLIDNDVYEKVILTRHSADQIKFNTSKARMPDRKPSQIKQEQSSKSDFHKAVKRNDELYKNSNSIFKETYPKPDFSNMSKEEMNNWWLETPQKAYQYLVLDKNDMSKRGQQIAPSMPHINKAVEDVSIASDVLRLFFHNNNLGRIPKLEIMLMYKKPNKDNLLNEVDSFIKSMFFYLKRLYSKDIIESEEFEKFRLFYDDILSEEVFNKSRKYFTDLINNIDNKK
jgi:hypothetical protein